MLYGTGGLAYGGTKSSTSLDLVGTIPAGFTAPPESVGSGSFSGVRVGYTVGAGLEWMFAANWNAKLEYLYYDLGSKRYDSGGVSAFVSPTNFPGIGTAAIDTTTKVEFTGSDIRIGLNYHFN